MVLKGGMLLVMLDAGRSTRDADLLALELDRLRVRRTSACTRQRVIDRRRPEHRENLD
ncbi:MAG: hypothetical protein ACRDTD_02645 [Pseudonocardiaceae bacterium]